MKQMNVTYDGIGLINNRGASKYWGVTNYNQCSYTDWRIQFNVGGNANTFHFESCNPSEEVAASIIAKFYDLRHTGIKNVRYVKAYDNNWYKVDPLSRKIRQLSAGAEGDIPTGLIKKLPDQFTPQQNVLEFPGHKVTDHSLSQYEVDLVSKFIDGYKNDQLSEQGITLMGNILQIVSR